MRIARNATIAWIFAYGPFWPWNMVFGYVWLLVRLARRVGCIGNSTAGEVRNPISRVILSVILALATLGVIALAAMTPYGTPLN